MFKFKKYFFIAFIAATLCGCYHPEIQQGNNLTPGQIHQLKLGMSKTQVIETLGTPVMQNIFNPNVMIYISTDLPNHGNFAERKLTLTFKNDKLINISGASDFGA